MEESDILVLGTRQGIAAIVLVVKATEQQANRPSIMLGVFISAFLAQGAFTPSVTSMQGVDAAVHILRGQSIPTTMETFMLLQQLGTVLQVDVVDMLNRNPNRREALDGYMESLGSIGTIALRKKKELELQLEERQNERKEQSGKVRDISQVLREALRNEDYNLAAAKQEELSSSEARLAEIETKLDQTDDILGRFEDLLEIAEERFHAMEKNREILIAGLHVIEVPGIDNLGILDDSKTYRRSTNRRGRSAEDIFGQEYIQNE